VLDEAAIPAFTEMAAVNYRAEYNRDLKIHPLKWSTEHPGFLFNMFVDIVYRTG
jgi:hypothetical protein